MQEAFYNGTLADKSTCKIVVLITKRDIRDFRGIQLVEVLWNTVTSLLNRIFTETIMLYDVLHGFWAGCGTGNATSKAKLIQHLTDMKEAVLYKIILDLNKAYGALDWYRCLEILAEYGVGPKALRLLHTYWCWLAIVTRGGGYYAPLP